MVANRKPPTRARRGTATSSPPPAEPAPRDEVALAQRDRAVEQLRAVLALIDRKSFMTATDQNKFAIAEAFVAESERW